MGGDPSTVVADLIAAGTAPPSPRCFDSTVAVGARYDSLAEYDMPVPDGMNVKVVENADNCVHITMPAAPVGHLQLSEEELSNAAGGICDTRKQSCIQPTKYVGCPG
jgi:hypothetical protein